MRPFLYPSRFPWQFNKIDEIAAVLPDRSIQDVDVDKAKKEWTLWKQNDVVIVYVKTFDDLMYT